MKNKIPKKIHYIWFGNGEKNKTFYKCLKSWKKFLPDYEIIEWNESNFNIDETNDYVKEAYSMKKYAFVSDYARLKILYENGGIYFDTDVEVLKKIDKEILEQGYFAKERDNLINTGLGFCVPKNNKLVKIMMDDYENIKFIKEDGTLDLMACPSRNSDALAKEGYIIDKNIEDIGGIKVYDKEFFCGFDVNTQHYIITEKTFTVHHYDASWLSKDKKIIKKTKRIISKIIGEKNYRRIGNLRKK